VALANPCDLEITPDANIAVVRSFTPDLSVSAQGHFLKVFDATSGIALQLNSCTLPFTSFGWTTSGNHSDFVALNGSHAVVIGSADATPPSGVPETYVYILNISGSPTCLSIPQSPFQSSTPGQEHNGAHDVAITADGKWAVVNEQNWAHVFEVRTGTLKLSFNHQGFPGSMVDSVEVTNDRAIVVYSKFVAGLFDTWVTMIDLGASGGPQVHPSFPQMMSGYTNFSANTQFEPHDLDITPDGRAVVISMDNGIGAYRLDTGDFLGGVQDNVQRRVSGFAPPAPSGQVDSVEVTNSRAVAIGYKDMLGGKVWHVGVFGIDPSVQQPNVGFAELVTFNRPSAGPEPHDLEVTDEGVNDSIEKAVVSADDEVIVVHDLDTPIGNLEFFSSGGLLVSPYFVTGNETRPSDSAFFQPPPPSLPSTAFNAVVSGRVLQNGVYRAALLCFPRSANPAASAATTVLVGDPTNTNHTVGADLALIPATRGLGMRCTAKPDEDFTGSPPPGRDYLQFQVSNIVPADPSFQYTNQLAWGGKGTTSTMVDAIVAARDRVVSAGETLFVFGGSAAETILHFMKAQ
jgi:hypothetical protein